VGWDEDPVVAAWPGFAPLLDDLTADACVVGLGASGLAAIDALRERGLSVVGLDAGRVANGAAGRNGGFLLGGAAAALHQAADVMGADDAGWLYRQTLAELDRLTERLGPDVVRRAGSIRLAGLPGPPRDDAEATDREDEWADCQAQAEVLRRFGVAVEEYDGELGRGLFLPDDGAVNPARRALALATMHGDLYENSPVIKIESGRVTTERGSVTAAVIVVAVDGRLEVVLPELVGRVRTARLQMLATAPVPPRLPGPVYGRWGYDYAQQDRRGRLFVGGGRDRFVEAEWTTDASPTAVVQAHIEAVARRMAGGPVEVTHRWAASVGYTPDGRPLVTEVMPGVVACGGYCGTGNLVGPVAARAAVDLALDATLPRACFAS
jgi:glycine/D-amino acid oxidase-like deaminating enzyme